jgi:protein-S-isoprenylcysteine O-methyltransferase Ste14
LWNFAFGLLASFKNKLQQIAERQNLGNLRDKLRSIFEAFLTALLFGTQTIFNSGVFISLMIVPLLPYLFVLPTYMRNDPNVIRYEIESMFYPSLNVGQIILFVGLAIFTVAALQWVWYHHKKVGLFRKGLYSKIRHPQFTGIVIITLGLTIMVLISGVEDLSSPFLGMSILVLPQIVGLWFLQVLGYIGIARYEEWHLSKKFSEYAEYRNRVPFLFPIKNPKRIPETLFTVGLVSLICIILLFLPYDFIRLFTIKHLQLLLASP